MKKFVATVFAAVFAFTALSETAVDYVKTKTWCSLGTSITDFNDVPTSGRTKGYQYFLMDKLGWDRAKLTDSGHSGTLVSSSSSKPPDTPCDIYTVEYGVNDWGKGHPVGTLDDYTNYLYNDRAVRWNNFASCYRNLIEMIRKVNPGAIIILITPRKAYGSSTDAGTKMFPPACDDPTLADSVDSYYDPVQGAAVHGDQTYLKDYADLIKAIGEYEGFPVVDWYSDAATQDNLASLSVDVAVHPNDAGYEIMADLLAPKILEAVAARMGGDPADPAGAKLTLNPNGGTVSSATVSLPAAALPTPTRTGYHFVGWFEDKTLTSYDYDATKVTAGREYAPGTLLYGTPVTAPNADYADKTLYAKWVKTSVYEHFHGKKVAVYGDSVSTLLGYVPSAEAEMFNGGVFYGQSYVDMGINEHTQWWGQLVDALGMELLEINAIGGSSVGAYAYEYGLERKAMMNYPRMRLLDDAGTPDVILVAAGINDYNDSTTGFNANADYLTGDLDRVTSICPDFAKAYALMIRRLQDLYPDAEIVALSSFDVGAATATETGNNCIRRTCALYNVVNIDMRDAFTLNDGTGVNYRPHGIHPGISGFAAIANHFLESYAPIANPAVVPSCGHTWGFGVLTTPATATTPGVRTYTCRHCDATKTEEVAYVAVSEGTEADITAQAEVKGVYLMPDDRQVPANTVNKTSGGDYYNGYLDPPTNLIDGNTGTVYRDWILNDRYVAFTFEQPMVVTSVKLVGVRNMYPNRIQIVDPNNRLLGKTEGGIPWNSAAGEHQCTITTTERVPNTELRLAVDFEYVGKEFQLKEVQIFGYAAGEEPPPVDPPVTGGTLTLDPRGGAVSPTTIDLPASSLPTPVREGYHFVGWFKDDVSRYVEEHYSAMVKNLPLYPKGKYLFGTPVTSAAAGDTGVTLYAKWVRDEVYEHFSGKKAVFVGDSVTTLAGYAVRNESPYTAIHYNETTSQAYEINENTTWWGQLAQALGLTRLSVNAVSGSSLVESTAIAAGPRAISCVKRIDDFDVNGTPDVIFIFGGINDFAGSGAPIDDFDPAADYLTGELDTTSDYFDSFAKGYATMIRRIRNYYPQAEIVAILPYVAVAAQEDVYAKGCATITGLCDYFQVACVDLRTSGLPANWSEGVSLLQDSIHPNAIGFAAFANCVLETYEPVCAHANKTALTGVVAATCTTDGYSGDCTCLDCEKVLTGSVIPALGHLWGEWETTKEPSKTEEGSRKRECQRDGCDAEETQVIPKLADVVALRNVAVVTAVGAVPTLPETVKGLKADGTLGGDYSVVWPSVEAPAVEGVTTVTGTATVGDQSMEVSASIRAVSATPVNYSPSANPTTASNIIKGTISNNGKLKYLTTNAEDPFATGMWDDVICYGNIVEVTLEWSSEVTATKVRVYFVISGVNYIPPSDVKFYKGDDFSEEIEWTEGDSNHNGGNESWHEYVFTTPQKLSKLKFHQQSDKTNTNKMLFLRRLWVQGVGSVEPQTADTLTALEVDGKAVPGFDQEMTSYEIIDGQAITRAENDTDNVAVTILPKNDYKAYAVTLAEDGESTKTYTVSMPKSHDHVFGEWQVITPATVYAPGLRRRVCTFAGCEVKEEEVIPQIERRTVKWLDVDFANYADGSAIADQQVDTADGGTWAKPSDDDTATVAHGDPDLAALVVTNDYLCYAAKAQTSAGRDATVEFKAKFQKPTTDELPQSLDLGQTAVFVFPDGKGSCYKAYTSTGWVKLTGATPDFEKFVTIKIAVRYEYGERLAKVTIDGAECAPDGAETPWFTLAGSATKLTSVSFFGEFGLGQFYGNCLSPVGKGVIILFR